MLAVARSCPRSVRPHARLVLANHGLPSSAFNYPTSGSTTSYSLTFETWFNAPVGSNGGVILGQTVTGYTPGGSSSGDV